MCGAAGTWRTCTEPRPAKQGNSLDGLVAARQAFASPAHPEPASWQRTPLDRPAVGVTPQHADHAPGGALPGQEGVDMQAGRFVNVNFPLDVSYRKPLRRRQLTGTSRTRRPHRVRRPDDRPLPFRLGPLAPPRTAPVTAPSPAPPHLTSDRFPVPRTAVPRHPPAGSARPAATSAAPSSTEPLRTPGFRPFLPQPTAEPSAPVRCRSAQPSTSRPHAGSTRTRGAADGPPVP